LWCQNRRFSSPLFRLRSWSQDILRRAIAPATAALQYMHNAADDPTIVRPLDAPNIRRQARFDPLPLLIAQPKQVSAHDPNPLPKTNQDRIVRAEKLMSSDPRYFGALSQGNASVIWRANHSAVGLRVTANHNKRRRSWSRTRNANSC